MYKCALLYTNYCNTSLLLSSSCCSSLQYTFMLQISWCHRGRSAECRWLYYM